MSSRPKPIGSRWEVAATEETVRFLSATCLSPPPGRISRVRFLLFSDNFFSCGGIADAFKEDYDVVRAETLTGPDGKPKGAGTVLFATPEDAARAIRDFHDATFDGRVITVRFDKFAGQ